MKFVVFSDIHGNVYALEAMLKQAENLEAEGYIFCGDVMGYFMYQEKCIKYLQQLPNLYAVKGNHDFYYIESLSNKKKGAIYAEKYGTSYLKVLSSSARKYLDGLPEKIEFQCGKKRILITHGSPENFLEGRVYPDTQVDTFLYESYDIVILGHTHYRMYRRIGNTILLNPGSLGQPRDFKGYSYCIVDMNTAEFIFKTVKINQRKLVDQLIMNNESEYLVKYIQSKMKVID